MKLSVILIAYNMAREIPRTLQSLSCAYQQGCEGLDYEVLVIDNGSSEKLDEDTVKSFGSNFHYHYLDNPPPSPAYALNYAAQQAKADILCLMIDGAHMLTPGSYKWALNAFKIFDNPVVGLRYFYLGPGAQNETIVHGYSKQVEDNLLKKIDWPQDGYRLFEVGTALQGKMPNITWFNKMIESNCLFIKRSTYDAIGGANERFNIPGGGFLNIDLYMQALNYPGVSPVHIIGEGSFHQLHGGTTTNVKPEERDIKVQQYLDQYREIRGVDPIVPDKEVFYMGHLPTVHSKIHLKKRKKASL